MPRIHRSDLDDTQDEAIVPLSAEQVQELRKHQPLLSVWRVIGAQALAGLLLAGLAGAWFGASVARSVLCGAFAVVIPAAVFARGLMGRLASVNPRFAVVGFFVWELVKLVLTIAALVAAARWVNGLSWLALLAGSVVAMKVYWVALGVRWFYPVTTQNKE